ncbi:phospholipase D family protein [Agrobacterium pusense]|uniref:phospholipase D family protein n=1 Tax=Agrobacterium pusense TaxID=648995 RepID=UPI00157312CE|nr:phospholipase D family protein [Agrobacterium pusense]NTE43868.1 hypothetical protein [Agrobacterium pusense]
MPQQPGEALLELAATAEDDLLLVAPYIKVQALKRILDAHNTSGSVKVVTRWRLEELAAGVSDIEVYLLLRERRAELALHPSLHAKYYAAGAHALIGSANITAAALGWREDTNLEILVRSPRAELRYFEQELEANTIDVDDRLYERFRDALAAFSPIKLEGGNESDAHIFKRWRPTLRHPKDLFAAYTGRGESLSSSSKEAAELDLSALSPPPGLTRAQFELWIEMQLRQHPEAIAIESFLERPRRFGEMRDFIRSRGAVDGDRAWQQWMRWLLHFLSNDYTLREANYSEIFGRRKPNSLSDEEQAGA